MAPTGDPDRGALSVEQIEQDWWGDPPADATCLVRTAHELRRKPVAWLTAEDLRLLNQAFSRTAAPSAPWLYGPVTDYPACWEELSAA